MNQDEIHEITPEQAESMKDAVLFDVRELHEWEAGHIEGSSHLPLSALRQDAGIFAAPGNRAVILYCQRGVRSMHAAEILQDAGHKNLYSMAGGYEAWLHKA